MSIQTTPGAGSTRSRRLVPWVILVVGLLAAAAGGLYLLFGHSAPSAVGLASTAPGASTSAGASLSGGGALTGGVSGTWTVDASIGSFSDFSGSFVGYRVEEQLANVGANTAVGRTPDVTGTFVIDGTAVTTASFEANLTTLQSDSGMRDGQLANQGIQTAEFPTATFKLTSPIQLGTVPADGQTISVTATGDLTIHGVTKSVQIALQAKLSGRVITVVGSIVIPFGDYGMTAPQSMRVLSIKDPATLELQLQLTKQGT
jgi:polyisoprenoid-binding protein YceI